MGEWRQAGAASRVHQAGAAREGTAPYMSASRARSARGAENGRPTCAGKTTQPATLNLCSYAPTYIKLCGDGCRTPPSICAPYHLRLLSCLVLALVDQTAVGHGPQLSHHFDRVFWDLSLRHGFRKDDHRRRHGGRGNDSGNNSGNSSGGHSRNSCGVLGHHNPQWNIMSSRNYNQSTGGAFFDSG